MEEKEGKLSLGLEPENGEIKFQRNCFKVQHIGQSKAELYFVVTARVPIFPKDNDLITLCDNCRGVCVPKELDIQSMTSSHFGGRVLPMPKLNERYVIVYKD